ncbi:MAG: general secretion pathway protein GspG [Actinobacteria bacterium HGW-Actinobacteria-6]|jgi:prepilin-type N-terminal cleavage/methylation domain-containing protein|nr:MAG: general secretion pathway protein GspG [Actinobacteria bacterium HGW-Actinobacteria-6]
MQRHQDGFTLVELMVVVLIIGVLVSIAIPMFNSASSTASLRTCQSNQRTIEGACQTYRAYTAELWTQSAVFNGDDTADSVDLLAAKYFLEAPKCPKTKQFYFVTSSGDVTGDTNAAVWTTGHYHY